MNTVFDKAIRSEKGQGLLEFALVLPILLLIFIGIFDLGRVFIVGIVVENASREGARYLSRNPDDGVLNSYAVTRSIASQESLSWLVPLTVANVSVTLCIDTDSPLDGCDPGSPVEVTVSYPVDLVSGWVLPSPVPISRSTRMMVP